MLIAMMALVLLAEVLLLSGVRYTYDAGHGSSTGRWFSVHFGRSSGLREWWTNLDAGPGEARGPGEYRSMRCGHKFPAHCNSAFCGATWCNAQRWPIFGWLFVLGHSFRIWCGPTYGRTFHDWRINFRALRTAGKHRHDDLYSPISFR